MMNFIFGIQINIKVFYNLILSFWLCIARHDQSTQNRFAYLRLGVEEKGRRMVTTRLLLSKVSGQPQMIKQRTFQLHYVLLAIKQQTGAKSLKRNIVLITQKLFLFLCVCVCVCVCVCACLCVCMCVCGMVSQFDLSITKQNQLFVRCQSLSQIANTSL